jgi:hypothetical protein
MRYASAARALICSLSSTRATGWPLGVPLFECGVAPESARRKIADALRIENEAEHGVTVGQH